MNVIWQKTKTGCHEVIVTLPTRWQGEVNCIVGPFSSHTVAEYFAHSVVDFGGFEGFVEEVFPYGDAWYIEVQKEVTDLCHNGVYDTPPESAHAASR
jgi:hypothetical protein